MVMSKQCNDTILSGFKRRLIPVLGGMTMVAGTIGISLFAYEPSCPINPVEIDYTTRDGRTSAGRKISDFNNDGVADLISPGEDNEKVLFVAEDMIETAKEEGYIISRIPPIMTPEIRESASKILRAQQEYTRSLDERAYSIDKSRFDAYQESQESYLKFIIKDTFSQ